jgi:hypothetical protein
MVEVAWVEFEEVHCCHWADRRHFGGSLDLFQADLLVLYLWMHLSHGKGVFYLRCESQGRHDGKICGLLIGGARGVMNSGD